ncbi:hypothetical protein [Chryseobacterium camelliae]|uniref:hypothetical protein n=1 Tax=Chryseobacterium camelliae TaxID=1265445 RepID=UPI00285725A0|nr:hypothetical protein [Chryseobacterium camelliae]MDR6513703.1 hypothetical protein [Chryseobacterium camelliae]
MKKQFTEDLNTAVFTTKYILEKVSPILYVFHYEDDGAWQFSGEEENIDDKDYKVISLEEIIDIDNSILEVADLPLQHMAYRSSINEPWKIKKID